MIHQAFEECLFVHLTVIFVLHYYQNEDILLEIGYRVTNDSAFICNLYCHKNYHWFTL